MTVWVQFKFLIPKCAHDVNMDSGVFNYVPKVNLNIPSYITHPNWGDIYKKNNKKSYKNLMVCQIKSTSPPQSLKQQTLILI